MSSRVRGGIRRAAIPRLVLAALTATPLTADDWPQWRGPARDGRSAETGLLATGRRAGRVGSGPRPGPDRLFQSAIMTAKTGTSDRANSPE